MKLKLAFLSLIAFMSFNTSAYATERTNTGKVSRYYADDNGTVYMKLKDIDYNGCTPSKSNHYYTFRSDGSNANLRFDELFAMVLLHAETQKEITIRFDDQYCDEYGGVEENSPVARITVDY